MRILTALKLLNDKFASSLTGFGAVSTFGRLPLSAQVAELVDARRSGRRVLTDVRVRVSPWAPIAIAEQLS